MLVLVVEVGSRVYHSVFGRQRCHFVQVDGETIKVFGRNELVFHGFLYAKVEFDGGDDGAEKRDNARHGGNVCLLHVCLESDGGDGVNSAEHDEWEFKVLGIASIFPVTLFVVITIYNAIAADIVEKTHELRAPLRE